MSRSMSRFSVIAVLLGLLAPTAFAADGSGTVDDATPAVEFAGGPYAVPVPATLLLPEPLCVEDTPLCYTYDLTVSLSDELRLAPGNEYASLDIALAFDGAQNDLDLYVYDAAGNLLTSAAGGAGVQEAVSLPLDFVPNGVYRIQVIPWLVVGPVSFTGTINVAGLAANDTKSGVLGAGGLALPTLLPLALLVGLRRLRRLAFKFGL